MEEVTITKMSVKEFKSLINEAFIELQTEGKLVAPELDMGEHFNQKEAAAYLGISQTTLIAWKRRNKIPYQQIAGSSKIRFYKSELDLFLKNSTQS